MDNRIAFVCLHGSGGNGRELAQYFGAIPIESCGFESFHDVCMARNIQIFTPTADERPYSPAMQMPLTVWFDRSANYLDGGLEDSEDREGIEKSMDTILKIINAMEADFQHIFLGGFSMGGGLALHALTKSSKLCPKVRGIFTMGSYLVNDSAVLKKCTNAMLMEERAIKEEEYRKSRAQSKHSTSTAASAIGDGAYVVAQSAEGMAYHEYVDRKIAALEFTSDGKVLDVLDKDAHSPLVDIPVLMLHGEQDELIHCEWGKSTATNLLLRGIDVRFETYVELDHEIGEDQLVDILTWLQDVVDVAEYEEEEKKRAEAALHEHLSGGKTTPDEYATSFEEERERALGKIDVPADKLERIMKLREERAIRTGGASALKKKEDGGGVPAAPQAKPAAPLQNAGNRQQSYTITTSPRDSNVTVLHYPANESVLDILVARPVLACGGMFEFKKETDGTSGVYTEILFASDVDNLAREIGVRLKRRIESEGASLNACPLA